MSSSADRISLLILSSGGRLRTSNSIVEGLLGEVASLVGGVQDLVVEDGEVQGKTETDGVGRGEVGLGDLGGSLVGLEGLVGRLLALVANGELGKVAVVVTLPIAQAQSVYDLARSSSTEIERTSCGRRPWTRRSERRGSGACREPQGCPRRSWQARPRSSGGTP